MLVPVVARHVGVVETYNNAVFVLEEGAHVILEINLFLLLTGERIEQTHAVVPAYKYFLAIFLVKAHS